VATRSERHSDLDPTLDAASASTWRRWLAELAGDERRLGQFGAIVLAGFVGAIVVLYAFLWLADQVLDQETQALDLATLTYIHQFASPQLVLAAQAVSLLGSEAIWVIGIVMVVAFGWQRRLGAVVMLILVAGGAQILNDVLKAIFHRARPEPLVGFIAVQSYSFPSGHAMLSAAFYFYLAYLGWHVVYGWWRGVLVAAVVVLVLLIGLSRLVLEAHYLSDVVAGYLAGFLWTDAVILGNRALSARSHRHLRRPPRRIADRPRSVT
jgi:membrane-associated phospholipid phosphatase